MIEVREIDLLTAKAYLKEEKGFSDDRVQQELNRLTFELNSSVQLKDKEGHIVKGPIFEKYRIGAFSWLGAFDGNKFAGIHWHSKSWHANDYQSELKDILDGYCYADNEEVAIALDEKFKELIKDKFEVNYAFCFPEDQFNLDFRKKLGYTIWGTVVLPTGKLHYLKRLPNFKVLSPEEEKQAKIDALKKQLEELNAT
tara:strand:- start:1037 stop:1630 length:594 start_codon:yes stop_codon:yes gene_type:complete